MPGSVPGTEGAAERMMVVSHHLGANMGWMSKCTKSLHILNCYGRNQQGLNWNNGGVENMGASDQTEWLRRTLEEVTSMPRPKR